MKPSSNAMSSLFQRSVPLLVLLLFGIALSGGAPGHERHDAPRQQAPPNVLIFVADDAGWSDFGVYGNEVITTPNVDRLAETGLRVAYAFLTTPQCSPSRISILSGKYPHATGAEDLHMPLPEAEILLPTLLKEQGYFTGHMRKTHYGPNGERQFDWYSQAVEDFPEFLEAAGDHPFFLWVGFRDPHRGYQQGAFDPPHDPAEVIVPPFLADTPETRADLALYYDEIARMDQNIGRFLEALDARGLRENTLVVFLSDNGMPFPAAKGTLYDAGIRTPLIFSWPAGIEVGAVAQGPVSVIDLAPTLLELAGTPPPEAMQGQSIRALLQKPSLPGRSYVFSERNWHNCDEHMRSVRTARYKLIRNAYVELPHGTPADASRSPSWYSLIRRKKQGALTWPQQRIFQVPRPRIELYDLQKDPGEFYNVADEADYAEVVRELTAVLDQWIDETGDFPPTIRRRDDNTDRITGVKFTQKIPPMREMR